MKLPFEPFYVLIAGQTYWWWCEFIGNLPWVYVGLVAESDALAEHVVRLYNRSGFNITRLHTEAEAALLASAIPPQKIRFDD